MNSPVVPSHLLNLPPQNIQYLYLTLPTSPGTVIAIIIKIMTNKY